jgi:hypothetical protein
MDSASIAEDWVRKNAMNFVTAIPMFAISAATTAFVPPSPALMPAPRSARCRHAAAPLAPRACPLPCAE